MNAKLGAEIEFISEYTNVNNLLPRRHPYPPINVGYRYRFHAPQHDTYEVSGVNFTTEKLENYNWNYMDHYICTRGDVELALTENLKYWRYRMYLLPKEHPAMKKILEGKSNRCDIYTEVPLNETGKQQIDDFLRYVEMYLNRIKRTVAKKPRVNYSINFIVSDLYAEPLLSYIDVLMPITLFPIDCEQPMNMN